MFRELVLEAAALPAGLWDQLEATARQVTGASILPVVGAGASRPCGVPLAGDLARELHAKAKSGAIAMTDVPSDFDDIASDLGRVTDALYLEHSAEEIVEAVGFGDRTLWPSPEDVAKLAERKPHSCAYRVLARLAKESLLSEAISFNYDCHFEGGLLKEGFFASRSRAPGRWPERFTVIANADQNAAQRIAGGRCERVRSTAFAQAWGDRREGSRPL